MLILASASPRRRELLAQAGYTFHVVPADIDEAIQPNESAATYVHRLAQEKARAVWNLRQQDDTEEDPLIILAADTCVVSDGTILGKPDNVVEATRMLKMLAGRTHAVLTGIAAVTRTRAVSDVEVTQVSFDLIPDEEIEHYIATGEPFDKAGAYGIQGYAARWIPRIEGCYFNVMGLPIARTVALLTEAAAPPKA